MKELIQAIKLLVPKKTNLPIIENIALLDDKVAFTNLDIHMAMPYQSGVQACIGAKDFIRIVEETQEPCFSIVKDGTPQAERLVIRSGKEVIKLCFQNVEDFPQPAGTREATTVGTMNEELLIQMRVASQFVSEDELRPLMMQIYWKDEVVSTDGHRMFFFPAASESAVETLVNPLTVKLLSLFCKEDWTVSEDKTHLFFENKSGITIVQRKSNEADEKGNFDPYPQYKNVIPLENNLKFETDRKEFLKTVKRVMTYAPPNTKQVRLSLNGKPSVSATDIDYGREIKVAIEGKMNGKIEIAFNADYMISILQAMGDEQLEIAMDSPTRAMIINDHFLLMPTRIME